MNRRPVLRHLQAVSDEQGYACTTGLHSSNVRPLHEEFIFDPAVCEHIDTSELRARRP